MEYVDGVPLLQYCRESLPDIEAKLWLFREICAAVEHVHRAGAIHRDLKPPNILVTHEGRPKLLDFGIAKWLDHERAPAHAIRTISGFPPLTPDYASPEQWRGRAATEQTDVYGLGTILKEILTGASNRGLDHIVRKATYKNPSRRYASVTELSADVRSHLSEPRIDRKQASARGIPAAVAFTLLSIATVLAIW